MAARKKARKAPSSPKKPRSQAGGPSLSTWISQAVEQVSARALRGMVDAGGAGVSALLPGAPGMRRETGHYLRELRELAGMTVDELTAAADLRDESLLAMVEAGTATLSFELILRLAAILARRDPVPFVTRMVRTYNPVLWKLMEDWGVGRIPLQFEREREFVNILRSHDAARELPDEEFAHVLKFTRSAFELALHQVRKRDE
jgi:transcriptional regulator with XRE-family HTH domain